MTVRTLALALVLAVAASADGERDNQAENVRRIPPPGVAVPDADKAELTAGLEALGKEIDAIRSELQGKPALALLPDVQIYHKSVDWALRHNEFFNVKEIPSAKSQLQFGLDRAKRLRGGTPNWGNTRGPVSLGYVSKIDGSVQPYNLFIPMTWSADKPTKHRLDTWFHGRGETLSELSFLNQKNPEFQPPDTFVLSLYGRYCCANKLAGEVDLFEALDDVKRRYKIDENRIVIRGFSMGGAACWQFAAHYPGKWAAAAPGAGFSETPDFLKVFQNEKLKPTDYEQKLWHMYDCTDYAVNFYNLPTVAYSGEIDKQKQAADMMAAAMQKEGLELTHLIGPKTGHSYEKATKEELIKRIDAIVAAPRNPVPKKIRFTTWTLIYNEMLWLTVDGLGQHWERARVDAELVGADGLKATTVNVTGLTFSMGAGLCPLEGKPKVTLDDQVLEAPAVGSDKSWTAKFHKEGGKWVAGALADGLRKKPGLCGPIDHAFMDSFLMVKPSGKPLNETVGEWAAKEMDHAIVHWRQQYRGDARVTGDDAVSEADIASSNLVLWGDPSSNKVLARIADKLPIQWTAKEITVGAQTYPADTHVGILIYPNPLNPKKYVVLNSGFTFREYDYLNNARQVPKLPDWAVVDITTPANSRWPGNVVAANFFSDAWELSK
ncbi:MAG TPA: prolyl oligopeptidase family serine peptidase [Planctomycetota bacterium]|nr:prolyl oligopeptidase family serine peptidase [Planctomycetota bacterium]